LAKQLCYYTRQANQVLSSLSKTKYTHNLDKPMKRGTKSCCELF